MRSAIGRKTARNEEGDRPAEGKRKRDNRWQPPAYLDSPKPVHPIQRPAYMRRGLIISCSLCDV